MKKRYYSIFFEKLNIAATQKAPLFNKIALLLSKYAFLSESDFVDKMYEIAFTTTSSKDVLERLSTTYVPSDAFKKWVYCQVCQEFSIGLYKYNSKIETLISSIEYAHICFTSEQINFLEKNYSDYQKQIEKLAKITPPLTVFTPNFLDENRKSFQEFYRQLQCYDFIYTEHNVLCDWQFSNDSFEKFVVKLCANRPELFEKIYYRMHFNLHEALLILFKNDFFKNYSGLDVLKFESAIKSAIGQNINGENYKLLNDIVEVILHQPNSCHILYLFASIATEENLRNHTFVREIISLSYADQYLQLLFLIASNSPSENLELIISDVLRPILDFDEDFKTHLCAASLFSKIQIVPSLYKTGIKCLIEYFEAFK